MAPVAPNLKISPIPFQPSRLGIPPSPFSPRSPITPPPRPSQEPYTNLVKSADEDTLPPPGKPLQWLWKCHMCNHNYPLGTTRRCLEDGHLFCSGTTVIANRRRRAKPRFKRHRACTSEFDYQGWKKWSNWRRGQTGYTIMHSGLSTPDSGISMSPPRTSRQHKDCWHRCDYPSECRWGVESTPTPQSPTPTVSPRPSTPNASSSAPSITFDTILGLSGLTQTGQLHVPEADSPQSPTRNALGSEFWQSILSVTRGRRAADPGRLERSPLRLNPVQEEEDEDEDGTSSATTPNSSPTEEETEEFVDAMDVDTVDEGVEGELQMPWLPSIPLRRFSHTEEDLDSDDESMDEEEAAIARYSE